MCILLVFLTYTNINIRYTVYVHRVHILLFVFKLMMAFRPKHVAEIINKNKSSGATALQGFGRQSGRRRSAKLVPTFADRGVSRGQRNGSQRPLISVYRTWIATYFYSSSSSIDLTRLTRLSAPRSRPTATQKIW